MDVVGNADIDPYAGGEIKGLPVDQEVGIGGEPGPEIAGLVHGFQRSAGHDARRCEREVSATLNRHVARNLPVETEARDIRVVFGRAELRMVSAHGEDEVARIYVVAEPAIEGEAARQMAVRVEDVGVARQERLGFEQALVRQHDDVEVEFHVAVRRPFRRKGAEGLAEHEDLEFVPDFDDRHHVGMDQLEGSELDAGRKPVFAKGRFDIGVELLEDLSELGRCGQTAAAQAELRWVVQPGEKRKVADLRHGGNFDDAVVAKSCGKTGDEESGRPADLLVEERETEHRIVGLPLAFQRRESAECRDREVGGFDDQRAVEFFGAVDVVDQQAALDGERGGLKGDSEALQTDFDIVDAVQPEDRHRGRKPDQLDAESGGREARIQQNLDVVADQVETDFFDEDRADRLLDVDPEYRRR